MKPKNIPKNANPSKIIKWVSRLNEIERNGGGQFVSMNRAYKDKSKYDRNDKKKELRNNLNSYFFLGNYIQLDPNNFIMSIKWDCHLLTIPLLQC